LRSDWGGWACCVACGAVGVAAFAPTLRNDFVYDDTAIVKENWIVKSPDAWYRFLLTSYWPPKNPDERRMAGGDVLYRPLTIAALRLQYLVHGGSAWGYHLVNVLLHGLIGAVTCAVAWRLWDRKTAGLVAGLLFAVHPLHADAVAPIVGLSELLAAFFALWLVVRHLRAGPLTGAALVRFHLGSAVLFAAAIAAKEHALLIWPIVLLIDARNSPFAESSPLPARRRWRTWADYLGRRGHIGFAFGAAAFFAFRFYVFGQSVRMPPSDQALWANPLAAGGWLEHVLTPFRLLWLTARLLVDPSSLCPLWGPDGLVPPHGPWEIDVWLGLILAIVLLAATFRSIRNRGPAAIGLLGFTLLLLVPLHVIPTASWFFAERWLYLPSAFLFIALAGVGRRLPKSSAIAAVCVAAILLPCAWSYARAWHDDESLNTAVLRRQPDSFQAAKNLAVLRLKQKRYEDALKIGIELRERFPDAWQPCQVLYESYLALGDTKQAEEAKAERDARAMRAFRAR